jgi:hypothetical protein
MAVTTHGGRSIQMTAANDAYTGFVHIVGINFQGTGLTAGHRVRILDTGGAVLADYIVEAASDNADLWAGRVPAQCQGVRVENNTIGGAWVLTVLLG